jgi:hypothetical protein
MNFWNLNENKKPENTVHSVGLEFGLRPGIVGPAQRPPRLHGRDELVGGSRGFTEAAG